FTFTKPSSPQAYVRKLLHFHSSGSSAGAGCPGSRGVRDPGIRSRRQYVHKYAAARVPVTTFPAVTHRTPPGLERRATWATLRKPPRPWLPPVPQLVHIFREPLHGGVVLATLLPGLLDYVIEELPRRLLRPLKHDSVFSRDDEERRPGFERERLANRTRNDDLSAGRDAGGKGGSHNTSAQFSYFGDG